MPPASLQRSAPPEKQYWESPFVYNVDFTSANNNAINAGATQNGVFQVQADSEFKWMKGVYQADIAAAAFLVSTQPVPNIVIQITDQGSGRNLFYAPIPIGSFFGFGYLPALLPRGYIFKPKSSVTVQVTNYDAAVNYNLRLGFVGTKIFEGAQPR